MWSMQKPVHKSNLQDFYLVELQKYCLVLDCIETNTNEYLGQKKRFDKLIENVEKQKPYKESEDESDSLKDCLHVDFETESDKSADLDWEDVTTNGDILSNLMNLEKMNMFSSKKLYDFKSINIATRKKALLDNDLSRKMSTLSKYSQYILGDEND